MDFFIKCMIFMLVLTFGPFVCYFAIGLIFLAIGTLSGKDDK